MTKSQTHQEEMLSKEGTQSYQIVKNSLNETPKPPEERVTSENHPTTPIPGPPLNQTIPTNILQDTFYGTRLVLLNNNDGDTIIISDTRLSVRHLDEINEEQLPTDSVIFDDIKGKSYVYVEVYPSDNSVDCGVIFDRKCVEEIFKKVDSETTNARIKNITWELVRKKEKLLMETDELQRLEEELKWLQHEQKKQIPEDITDQIIGE